MVDQHPITPSPELVEELHEHTCLYEGYESELVTRARQQLDALLAQITIDHQALDKRERQLAQAAEQLSQEAAVRAAWQQGGRHERNRVAALIDLQLDQLNHGGVNAVVLCTLRRMVLEVEA